MSNFIFSELKTFFANPFSKRRISKYAQYLPSSFSVNY